MPQFGRIPASLAAVKQNGAGSAPAAPWELSGVTAQMATFEVDAEATLDLLPEMLSRPAPPYARILVQDFPDSPVGPYREALLLISCRFAMLPRQFIAGSLVSSAAARDANLQNWHYLSEVGDVSLRQQGSEFTSELKFASGLSIRITSPNAQETGPAVIRYDPVTVVRQADGGPPGLATVSAEPPGVSQAWLATATRVEYSGGERQSPWLRLRSLNPITATIAKQDVLLPEPKAVSSTPGMGGGGGP
jgi:hypothetical protein